MKHKRIAMRVLSIALSAVFLLSFFIIAIVLLPTAAATQFARPDGTICDDCDGDSDLWTDATGYCTANTNDGTLWDEIDEVTADDAGSCIVGPVHTGGGDEIGDTAEVTLTDGTDPVSSSDHIIRFRAMKVGGKTTTLFVELRQGSTVKATSDVETLAVSGTWADYSYTLTSGEANSITDYSDLRLQFNQSVTGGGSSTEAWVTQAFFEYPDAGGATCEALTVVVTNPSGQLFFNGTTDTPTGGLWQEENVSEDFQGQMSTSAINVTNDDTAGACDVTLELLTSPGSGRTMKFNTTSTAPTPDFNNIPVGSNITVVNLASETTQAIWLWIDLDDSQGGSVTPTLRVDTELP